MLRKRLIGVITCRNGVAVQSQTYCRYLPVGDVLCVAENLDRWGVDEVLVQCIDRSAKHLGPDFALLDRLSGSGLSTPLTYAGGIRNKRDAIEVIRRGADRIALDTLLHQCTPETVRDISASLGAQAVIGVVPLLAHQGRYSPYSHVKKQLIDNVDLYIDSLLSSNLSEIMLVDVEHDGISSGFDVSILQFLANENVPIIAFGGISDVHQHRSILQHPNVSATAVGNFLLYQEHAVQLIKSQLKELPIREATYAPEHWNEGGHNE